jgi:hypothetical protein
MNHFVVKNNLPSLRDSLPQFSGCRRVKLETPPLLLNHNTIIPPRGFQ